MSDGDIRCWLISWVIIMVLVVAEAIYYGVIR
jgi:hypothetical protein